ncbi:Rod binding protein [Vibrio xiamenensis]|uniref:Rod binding protein n=1 Tax=Vibrio xiamenensis TaxID=861298 RepID=A0A1G7ZYB1_9VIBR|nr:rod-binding protein [Vibrio xiamenensis]SDH13689.1 Rod binding protein [Vibrio xiamenensis]
MTQAIEAIQTNKVLSVGADEVIKPANTSANLVRDMDYASALKQVDKLDLAGLDVATPAGSSQAFYLDTQSINAIKYQSDSDAALRQVAEQFEALFVQQMLKQMRTATEQLGSDDNPLSNNSNSMFQSMLDNQLASSVSQQSSFGLADMLYQQLSGHSARSISS